MTLRPLIAAALGLFAARIAWAFADELIGIEQRARSAARGISA